MLASAMFKLVLLFLFQWVACSDCMPWCHKSERKSLLAVKRSLVQYSSLLPSGPLDTWNGTNCCDNWRGIFCSKQNGHVVKIDLRGGAVGGSIHSALFNLTHLEHLDLSSNNFHGIAIPKEIGHLTYLNYLNLSMAGFVGVVPPHLANLSRLQFLDLSSIAMRYIRPGGFQEYAGELDLMSSGLEWLKMLRNLKSLSLGGINLTMAGGSWGEAIGALNKLQYLNLQMCRLEGYQIPYSFSNLTLLSRLYLDGNSFSQIPPWFSKLNRLVSLGLSSLYLKAPVFSSLTDLHYLEELWLYGNLDLKENISEFFSQAATHWPRLTCISLYGCGSQGVIPDSVSKLSSLTYLDLSFNGITGNIPESIGNLSKLIHLNLNSNWLNGNIPFSLGKLSKLEFLYISRNRLNGSIPSSLGFLSYISWLDLSGNYLMGNIPSSLGNLSQLAIMDLSSNLLTGTFSLSVFYNLSNLQELSLSDNKLTINMISSRGSVKPAFNISKLQLRSCNIQGAIPSVISTQTSMYVLDLSNNNLVGIIPKWMLHRLNLQYLLLSSNHLTGPIPSLLINKGLLVVDLSNNKLSGKVPLSFGEDLNSSLLVVNLANNSLDGEIPSELRRLKNLLSLHISNNQLTGHLPSSLQECTKLSTLDLGNNNIAGAIPEWIPKLSNLRVLVLRNNNLSGHIPPEIGSLHQLRILDLSNNNLSGGIPADLINLRSMASEETFNWPPFYGWSSHYNEEIQLTTKGHSQSYESILSLVVCIDLSQNNLVGEIPSDIGNLRGLILLNVSRNHLTGTIPDSLGSITNLDSVDLSYNQLSGRIPGSIAGLGRLGNLNMSYNNLSGRIPRGGRFETIEASSFLGNPNLCGITLSSCLSIGSIRDWTPAREIDDSETESYEDEDDEVKCESVCWYVSVGCSYGTGFCGVFIVLGMKERWKRKYNEVLDWIIIRIMCSSATKKELYTDMAMFSSPKSNCNKRCMAKGEMGRKKLPPSPLRRFENCPFGEGERG